MTETPIETDEQENPHQTWDDFWAEVSPPERREVIRGVEVTVPRNLPLKFNRRLEELRDSTRDEDVAELVGMLFGPGVLDQWIENGMSAPELQVVLAWGIANGNGQDFTFRQAYEAVRAQQAGQQTGQGKASRPTTRRAATGGR